MLSGVRMPRDSLRRYRHLSKLSYVKEYGAGPGGLQSEGTAILAGNCLKRGLVIDIVSLKNMLKQRRENKAMINTKLILK